MLETIWFLLWGILWAVYFVLDGYDLGLASLMPFLAKSERDRKVIHTAIGPFWDGNEVWLLTAGGVTFAAFPKAYAVMFSGLYTALMLLLMALIIRGVAYEFRHHALTAGARRLWDRLWAVSSFIPALLLGVAFANIFKGLPLDEQGVFQGGLFDLLNFYGIVGGLVFVLLFFQHGVAWLGFRSEGELQDRAAAAAKRIWPVLLFVYLFFLVLTATTTNLLANYFANPVLLAILIAPVWSIISVRIYVGRGAWGKAWISSAVLIGSTALFGVIGLYPALLPSSIDPAFSVTIHNAASSPLTLKIMLGVAGVVTPVVIAYQSWMHRKFGYKITDKELEYDRAY